MDQKPVKYKLKYAFKSSETFLVHFIFSAFKYTKNMQIKKNEL